MFGKFTNVCYTLLGTLPAIGFLWWRHGDRLRRGANTAGITTAVFVLYCFIVWRYGPPWGAWAYGDTRISGVYLGGALLDDLVWFAFVVYLYAAYAVVAAGIEDEQTPLWQGLLKKKK